ncbi:MAG: c-type cytochrome [Marinomonas sp.]
MQIRLLSPFALFLLFIFSALSNQAFAERSGSQVVNTFCVACHISGVAGAPRLGNKEEWQPRLQKSLPELLSSVTNGLNAMPPKGLCSNCTDKELDSAIQFMIDKSQ